eukprot:750467-Hanusia_phi.AAC.1
MTSSTANFQVSTNCRESSIVGTSGTGEMEEECQPRNLFNRHDSHVTKIVFSKPSQHLTGWEFNEGKRTLRSKLGEGEESGKECTLVRNAVKCAQQRMSQYWVG